jgi:predicted transcriptional regulator
LLLRSKQVLSTLQEIQTAEVVDIALPEPQKEFPEGKALTKSNPADSIRNDKVICLECGAEFKQLNQKHFSAHGLTPEEYRQKYGFTMRTPLSAKSITKVRSKGRQKERTTGESHQIY